MATESNVAPASALVDGVGDKMAADLFAAETVQLTDEVLSNLTRLQLSNNSLFQFAQDTNERRWLKGRTSAQACKTFPGDLLWPSDSIWKVFDLLLGGALIKMIPYAAPCFDDFGVYNASKCASLSVNWANGSYTQ